MKSLSFRLGLFIVLIITVVFTLLFGFLFYRCKRYIQNAAIDRATQLLDNTAERINGIMDETELVTNFMAQTTARHLSPDSLQALTNRMIGENTFLTGFTTEWYNIPRTLGTPYWADAYEDYKEGTLSSPDILTSYCCPVRGADGRYVGAVTASLTLKWLSRAVTSLKPYPHSSAIMIGRDGTYLVHPDTSKLFRQTIFSDPAPEARTDILAMGRAMLAGHSGMTRTIVDGHAAFIFYRPLQRTGWSIAIVCPESDVFTRYNRLVVIAGLVIGLGLALLMLFCYLTVRRAVQPLSLLDEQARRIAEGHFDEPLPQSTRRDSVGRLQNSFISMQQSLAQTVTDIRTANEQLSALNAQLSQAYQLKLETNRRKATFIRDMYHEIRTPLNIIGGFAQILTASIHSLPADEVTDITARMKQSASDISRLAHQLEILT
jgi:sigma-B regulation protein RsbU (phosphoserine phosphatase)